MRGVVHLEPLRRVHLVRAEDAPDLVVEDLGRGAGQRGEADVAKPREEVGQRHAERGCSLPDLERGEGVDVEVGQLRLDCLADLDVVVAREARVDAALQADLRRTALPGLVAATDDLLERHHVRGPPQVLGQLALRERAEPAAEVADVRVVDVARDDVAHRVAAHLAPELVRRLEDGVERRAPGLEQGGDVVLVERDLLAHLRERGANGRGQVLHTNIRGLAMCVCKT